MRAIDEAAKAGVMARQKALLEARCDPSDAPLAGVLMSELAKRAQQRTQDESVGKFAAMMIEDHTRANGQLAAIRDDLKLERPAPADKEHGTARKAVEKHEDPDREYVATEITDPQKAANLLFRELSTGQNDKLLAYSRQTSPAVLMPLEAAQQIQAATAR